MAIGKIILASFKQLLGSIGDRPVSMVMAGYQDILVPADALVEVFGPGVLDGVVYRADSAKVLEWHNKSHLISQIVETKWLFQRIGIEPTFIDIVKIRGDEEIVDLNGPLPATMKNRFDIVYDGGTLEHCFNVGQAIANMLGMAKVGGYVIHCNPLSMINHGFFNFCPTFYADFYIDNGHRLASPIFGALSSKTLDNKLVEMPNFGRMGGFPDNGSIFVIAQKLSDRAPVWPMQTKYKNSSQARGGNEGKNDIEPG